MVEDSNKISEKKSGGGVDSGDGNDNGHQSGKDSEIIDVGISTPADKGLEILENPLEELNKEINNGSGKMKVKCIKCNILEELKDEDVKLLAYAVKKYNPEPDPVDYLSVWSIIRGNCTDKEKHIFIFDELFDKDVADTIKEFNDAIISNNERKAAFEKVCHQIDETTKILKDLEKKKTYALAEMSAGGMLIDNIKLKFVKLTGMEDMTIWS